MGQEFDLDIRFAPISQDLCQRRAVLTREWIHASERRGGLDHGSSLWRGHSSDDVQEQIKVGVSCML